MVKALERGALPERTELSPARRRLFETALALFSRDGYNGVSVRDIVKELDQHPTAIYAHVSSKQELIFELVKLGFTTHRDRVAEALLEAGADPVDQIRALCEAHVRVHLDYPALARVTNRASESLEAEHAEERQRRRSEAARTFQEVVARGQRLGVFADDDPLLLVQAIGGMGSRAPEWWAPDSGVDPEHVVQTFADFAVRILTGGKR
jgi:AcrR family transcriptional regulator